MDIEEIKEMPEFEHDIDRSLYDVIPLKQRPLAETISKLRQEVRWVGQKTIIAHNLSVQTAKILQRTILAAGSTAGLFFLTKLLELLTHK